MTFMFAPDFVVSLVKYHNFNVLCCISGAPWRVLQLKRKRKRSSRPIDPCLGFYPDLKESSPTIGGVEYAPASAHALAHSVTGIANPVRDDRPSVYTDVDTNVSAADLAEVGDSTLPETDSKAASDATEAQLTVEEFLRRAASPTKRYTRHRARQRKKARGDHIPSDDTYLPSSDPMDESDAGNEESSPGHIRNRCRRTIQWTSDELEGADASQPPSTKRRRINAKKSQKLSTRLLLAGASTGVDLLGGHLLPLSTTHISTRRPIPLVPDNRMPSPPASATVVRRQYVDPRRATPFHNVTFQFSAADSDHGVEHRKAHARPVTAWRPTGGSDTSRKREGGRAGITRKASQRLVMIPLVLTSATSHGIIEPPR
ncbi:hypothetical protein C8Q73DRAFT_28853 [Cubamyces lactineus]|nr:hypothetical protein C8Q73DRAFT_28853 [Cubamyces lactineus]